MPTATNPDFNPSGSEQVASIKAAIGEIEKIIIENTPSGRRRSLALTHLEIAAMFAVKSVFEP